MKGMSTRAHDALRKLCLALVTVVTLSISSGCFGHFHVTQHVHAWNGRIDGKWGNELAFIFLTPIYSLATIADAFVFNLVEFWTGVNPIIPVDSDAYRSQSEYGFEHDRAPAGPRTVAAPSAAADHTPGK